MNTIADIKKEIKRLQKVDRLFYEIQSKIISAAFMNARAISRNFSRPLDKKEADLLLEVTKVKV